MCIFGIFFLLPSPPPSHSFLKQQTHSGNASIPSGKTSQNNSTVSDSVSSKCQGKGPAIKVVPSPSKKVKLDQVQPAKHAGNLQRKESSGSSSSSDSEEEAAALRTATQITQPGKRQRKLPVIFETWQAPWRICACTTHSLIHNMTLLMQERLFLNREGLWFMQGIFA